MKIRKSILSILLLITVILTSTITFGCGGTSGLVYELSDTEDYYVCMGFDNEVEEFPEIVEVSKKHKGKVVKRLGASAFKNKTTIKKVILPEGLEEINSAAFRGCTNLEEVVFPSTLTYVGSNVFNGCKKLKNAIIPNGMKEIPAGYIYGCESLTEFTIPDSIKKIQPKAFGKTGIKKLVFPNSVEEILKDAFFDADKLEEISLGSGVKSLSEKVFAGCTALKKLNIAEGLVVINRYAFDGCTALEEITIPKSVRAIYGNAFYGCTALRKMTIVGATCTKCENPKCGVTICPDSIKLGFQTHYHINEWRIAEDSNPAYKHYHDFISHDISDPNEAWKYFTTEEAKTMHDYPNGMWLGYKWAYNEATGKYTFDGKSVNGDVDYDASIRSWTWDASKNYIWYKGVKGDW